MPIVLRLLLCQHVRQKLEKFFLCAEDLEMGTQIHQWTLSKISHTTFYGNRFVSLGIRYSSCLSWRSHSLFGGGIKHTLEHIALLSISV